MQGEDKYVYGNKGLLLTVELATAIGINEAIFLQKLHYWLQLSEHKKEGRKWVYNSFNEWQAQMPFFSLSTVKRIIKSLKTKGLIIVDCFNKKSYDKTNWYTINYEEVSRLSDSSCQIEPTSCQNDTNENDQIETTLCQNGTKTLCQSETTDLCQDELTNTNKYYTNKDNTINTTNTSENDVCQSKTDVVVEGESMATQFGKVIDKWNTLSEYGVPKTVKITPSSSGNRPKLLKARLKEYGLENILKAIDNIKDSKFLQGGGDRGWKINFEWFVKPNNFPKVLEGLYNNSDSNANYKSNKQSIDSIRAAAEEGRRREGTSFFQP